MKTTLTTVSLVALLAAGAALADDDVCTAPRDTWQSREAAMQMAQQNGWTVREIKIDDGCYEIEGRDSDGREIEVKVDPATLKVVETEFEDDDNRDGARSPTRAGTAQPPQNGLFGNGAPPQVQVN
ncbi:PepSY domain-containing protein [Roseovarius sp. SCSIO 43702]|uniref:PepSY domain-containing protein n=1 Tax=Roseovarius sp. SCSIO 43702 TaxID=2823043 RepID=UPI001C7346A4|nr:PepSY domain-containing protein [Roseovarius sp. SCSIO 43702]QYX57580.1 PepSY domain-containing protein [Roseovarius sp. SCSIO 43702]